MKKRILFLLVAVVALLVTLTSCENLLEDVWPSFDPPGFNEEKEETVFPSVGLSYEFVTDEVTGEQYYMVVGRGSCTDEHIILPERYKTFPITHIADGAFMNDTALTGITLTNNIKWIGSLAFAGTSITKLDIPDSVEMVMSDIIAKAPVKEITVGKNCVLATMALARSTALETIVVHEENENYVVVDGVLYGFQEYEDGSVEAILLQYPTGSAAKSFAIPEEVNIVDWFAFSYANNLEEITIPGDTVLNMPFFWCDNLKVIYYQVDFDGLITLENVNNTATLPNALNSLTDWYIKEMDKEGIKHDMVLDDFNICFNDVVMTNDEFLAAFEAFRDELMGGETNEPEVNEPEVNEPEVNEPEVNEPEEDESEGAGTENNGEE